MLRISPVPVLCWAQETAVAGQKVAAPMAILLCVTEQSVGHLVCEDSDYRWMPRQRPKESTAPVTGPGGWGLGSGKGLKSGI